MAKIWRVNCIPYATPSGFFSLPPPLVWNPVGPSFPNATDIVSLSSPSRRGGNLPFLADTNLAVGILFLRSGPICRSLVPDGCQMGSAFFRAPILKKHQIERVKLCQLVDSNGTSKQRHRGWRECNICSLFFLTLKKKKGTGRGPLFEPERNGQIQYKYMLLDPPLCLVAGSRCRPFSQRQL